MATVHRGDSPLLGLRDAPIDGKTHSSSFFTNKIGGLPWWISRVRASGAMDNASDYGSEDSRFDSWLARLFLRFSLLYLTRPSPRRPNDSDDSVDVFPSLTVHYPRCSVCSGVLAHVVQVYCPLEGSPYHRTINVFACPSPACYGNSLSWKVYCWNGQPVFITCPPSHMQKTVPPCAHCGSPRIFEFQLMPPLVSMLRGANEDDWTVEFGIVLIYTCRDSCWPSRNQTPVEEFPFVQADPDQKLFR
nr:PREDICTED: programmed cell death protein 2-like [Lepisosteus oculatus]